mmetsp:Transcript_931/g.2273  ORF Transcript_931/g.2273 Transcript_931/m.2273 type:complete len:202 (+) Transcript_931:196-801(+)
MSKRENATRRTDKETSREMSAVEWLARSVGVVDKMCCYSYSVEQIQFEQEEPAEMNIRSSMAPPSWICGDGTDSSLPLHEQKQRTRKTGRRGRYMSFNESEKDRHPIYHSPGGGSVSTCTATTVTTSSTATVRTGSRSLRSTPTRPGTRQHDTHPHRTTPRHISMSNPHPLGHQEAIQIRPVPSDALPGVPFYSATEGYQC